MFVMNSVDTPELKEAWVRTARRVQPACWLSAIALGLLLVGLVALAVPDAYEGARLVMLGPTRDVRTADVVGCILLAVGTMLAWGTAFTWQWRQAH
jgi:hypothetical protein